MVQSDVDKIESCTLVIARTVHHRTINYVVIARCSGQHHTLRPAGAADQYQISADPWFIAGGLGLSECMYAS